MADIEQRLSLYEESIDTFYEEMQRNLTVFEKIKENYRIVQQIREQIQEQIKQDIEGKLLELKATAFLGKDLDQANRKNIFVSPYQTLFYRYGLVGWKLIFLTSQIGYPLNLIVYSKPVLRGHSNNCVFFSRPIIP